MNDPSHSHDREFHDEAVSELYRATRDIEPPAWLDERILMAAQMAIAPSAPPAPPHSRRRSVRFWAMPAALAATVIMAVGIVRLARETGEWDARMDRPMKAQSLMEPAAEADTAHSDQRKLGSAKQQPAAMLPLPTPAPPAAPATRMMRSTPFMQGEGERISDERRKQNTLQTVPVMQDEDAGFPRQRADRSPEEWLADIARLQRQGRIAEAQASLEEFRRRYPSYPQSIREGTD